MKSGHRGNCRGAHSLYAVEAASCWRQESSPYYGEASLTRGYLDPMFGKGDDGELLVGKKSHVRLAHPDSNKGAKLLRRGYNFVEGSDGLGQLSAGLFFLAYQRDPEKQFVRVQRSLAGLQNDLLNEYIVHVSSGIFACPPGIGKTGFWGETLFA